MRSGTYCLRAPAIAVFVPLALVGCIVVTPVEHNPPDTIPSTILVSPKSQNLASGDSLTFSAHVYNRAGAALGLSAAWASSDPSVVSIDQSGKATGAHIGVADITASIDTLVSSPMTLTVTPGAPARMELDTTAGYAFPCCTISSRPFNGGFSPQIVMRDKVGNRIISSNLPVTATISSGDATISEATAGTVDGGIVRGLGFVITGSGSVVLSFTAPGLNTLTSPPIRMLAAPALAFLGDSTWHITLSAGTSGGSYVGVQNSGSGGLYELGTISLGDPVYAPGEPTGWLTVMANVGAPGLSRFTASAVSLTPRDYHAKVAFYASQAINSPQSMSVILTVVAPAP